MTPTIDTYFTFDNACNSCNFCNCSCFNRQVVESKKYYINKNYELVDWSDRKSRGHLDESKQRIKTRLSRLIKDNVASELPGDKDWGLALVITRIGSDALDGPITRDLLQRITTALNAVNFAVGGPSVETVSLQLQSTSEVGSPIPDAK